ncbi:5-(carboxyamino)imidazole ribonucleotide mutase [Candidatus Daviesbacteria bacterium]|nr:5-(carboxyamino)imidazole ribonucleotide mutase [Candidatus Daviesbacteria bacterium]
MQMPKVAIILASDSDLAVMSDAIKVLEEFKVEYLVTISSAHRSPSQTIEYVKKAQSSGIKVIIASAGLAAHLAGVIAAHFPLPVIGVPIKTGALNGVDALYSTVQMPPGVPVATVAIDGAKNAGILAVQILATSDKNLEEKLIDYKKKMAESVSDKAVKLKEKGWQNYSKD